MEQKHPESEQGQEESVLAFNNLFLCCGLLQGMAPFSLPMSLGDCSKVQQAEVLAALTAGRTKEQAFPMRHHPARTSKRVRECSAALICPPSEGAQMQIELYASIAYHAQGNPRCRVRTQVGPHKNPETNLCQELASTLSYCADPRSEQAGVGYLTSHAP